MAITVSPNLKKTRVFIGDPSNDPNKTISKENDTPEVGVNKGTGEAKTEDKGQEGKE